MSEVTKIKVKDLTPEQMQKLLDFDCQQNCNACPCSRHENGKNYFCVSLYPDKPENKEFEIPFATRPVTEEYIYANQN